MLSPKPSGSDFDKFEKWWDWARNSLNHIMMYGKSKKIKQFPLERMLSRSIVDYRSGNEQSIITLGHLVSFIDDMQFLCDNDPFLFRVFRDKLSSGPGRQFQYMTGVLFEIKIASLLIRKRIQFKCPKPDPPDFEVHIDSGKISIECYCPRIKEGSSIYPKLLKSWEARKVKKYRNQAWTADGGAVLFIDGTWLLRSQGNEFLNTQYSLQDEITSTLTELKDKSFYSLVVLLWYGRLTGGSGQNGSTTSIVHSPAVISDPLLLSFIDRLSNGFKPEPEIKIMLPNLPQDGITGYSGAS